MRHSSTLSPLRQNFLSAKLAASSVAAGTYSNSPLTLTCGSSLSHYQWDSPSVAASQCLTALAFAHLVRYSVPVMIYLAPVHFPSGLIVPTKSIAHLSNARSGVSSRREGFPTLWKISQRLQKSLVSLCNVGHHNPAARIFCAVGFPAK